MTEYVDGEPTREDDELLAELRGALQRVEPVPAEVTAISRSLLSWRNPDAQLAVLVADTRELTTTVRGDTDVVLHFRAGDVEIVVQLSQASGGHHRLLGQVEPVAPGTVQIRRVAGQSDVPVDDLGRFVVERVPPGPVSLRWRPAAGDQPAVDTAWQLL